MNASITGAELRKMYTSFFESKGHTTISGASLIPENDPTVLFTTAGMHPLVPYLLGEDHPAGSRLCNVQKCIRTGDIDDVGDLSHLTFFEMLGNWSLGDYFKEEAIQWSHEFLTSDSYLGFRPEQLHVTVFEGNENIPKDNESIGYWKALGIPEDRIYALPMKDNWWGPAGNTGPCGPDTEMFVDTGKDACGSRCRPGCSCGKYFEIWNDVFMQYEKTSEGEYVPLSRNNVDTGMGVERTIAMLQGRRTVYETELFEPILASISEHSGKKMDESEDVTVAFRVVADHLRSATFIMGDPRGVKPDNLGQGYVLRRLIRRAVRFGKKLGLSEGFGAPIVNVIVDHYQDAYPELAANREMIVKELTSEEEKFEKTLSRGTDHLEKILGKMKEFNQTELAGKQAFKLFDTYGFPLEFTEEICGENEIGVDRVGYEKAKKKHQEASKKGDQAFKGGLADHSTATTALHTATHLLHKSLQTVLGDHVRQRGSNITPERLRFDFSHPQKVTPEEIDQVQSLVNEQIQAKLPVSMSVTTLDAARSSGAMALFDGKYDEQVKLYQIGDFSLEVCGGPHVENTQDLGSFRIVKEQASSAGVRRIRAVLE